MYASSLCVASPAKYSRVSAYGTKRATIVDTCMQEQATIRGAQMLCGRVLAITCTDSRLSFGTTPNQHLLQWAAVACLCRVALRVAAQRDAQQVVVALQRDHSATSQTNVASHCCLQPQSFCSGIVEIIADDKCVRHHAAAHPLAVGRHIGVGAERVRVRCPPCHVRRHRLLECLSCTIPIHMLCDRSILLHIAIGVCYS